MKKRLLKVNSFFPFFLFHRKAIFRNQMWLIVVFQYAWWILWIWYYWHIYLNNDCLKKRLISVNSLFLSFFIFSKKSILRNEMYTALEIKFWYSLFLTIYSPSLLYFRTCSILRIHTFAFQHYTIISYFFVKFSFYILNN